MPAELAGKVREVHGPVCAESSFQYYWGVDLANIPLSDSILGSRVFNKAGTALLSVTSDGCGIEMAVVVHGTKLPFLY